jgi:hypothetical protein
VQKDMGVLGRLSLDQVTITLDLFMQIARKDRAGDSGEMCRSRKMNVLTGRKLRRGVSHGLARIASCLDRSMSGS